MNQSLVWIIISSNETCQILNIYAISLMNRQYLYEYFLVPFALNTSFINADNPVKSITTAMTDKTKMSYRILPYPSEELS
jgi:hypothetical protein